MHIPFDFVIPHKGADPHHGANGFEAIEASFRHDANDIGAVSAGRHHDTHQMRQAERFSAARSPALGSFRHYAFHHELDGH